MTMTALDKVLRALSILCISLCVFSILLSLSVGLRWSSGLGEAVVFLLSALVFAFCYRFNQRKEQAGYLICLMWGLAFIFSLYPIIYVSHILLMLIPFLYNNF